MADVVERRQQEGASEATLRAVALSASFAEQLIAAPTEQYVCQLLADEIEQLCDSRWCAVFHLTGEASVFGVTAASGSIPPALHDQHNSTPLELAQLLGWRAGQGAVQVCNAAGLGGSPGRSLPSGDLIVAVLEGEPELQGVVAVQWPPGADIRRLLAAIGERCRLAAGALAHAKRAADLRMADRTKSEFVATMSHELRSPLSAILGYTELLVNGDFGSLGPEQGEIVRRAHSGARALLDLVNATLDVSRFEVGDRRQAESSVDLGELLGEQYEELQQARGRDATAADVRAATDTLSIVSDPLKLRVALRQLLDAVLDRSPRARLWISLHPAPGGVEVTVEPVASNAPPPLDRPFSLLIARRLVELLGGTFDDAADEGGHAIRLWLPATAPVAA